MKSNHGHLVGLSLFLVCASLVSFHSAQAQQKRRIAVLSFGLGDEAKQRAKESLHITADLGSDLSDQLVAKLVSDGKFAVIERAALDKIIKEQNLSNSDRLDPADAAKIGKIAGVDGIIIGTITQLTGTDKPTSGNIAVSILRPGTGYVERKTTVDVSATARLIDTNTGQVLSSTTGVGEGAKTYRGMKNASVDTSSTSFGNDVLHEAFTKAIDSMADQLEASPALAAIPAARRATYAGIVADVSGQTLILTAGTKAGAQVGDVVEISRVSRIVHSPTDPTVVLKVIKEVVGKASITEVDETSATATFSGAGTPKVKDDATYNP